MGISVTGLATLTLMLFMVLPQQPQSGLTINGKASVTAPIRQNGEVYVPLSALKAAGAQVTTSENKLSIRFLPYEGGSNQADAVEGNANEWLFNGIWRVRAIKVEPMTDPFDGNKPGYAVTLEVRNGAKKAVSMFATGAQMPQLVDVDGTALKVDEGAWQTRAQMKELLPGGSLTATIPFYYPHGTPKESVREPEKLVLLIDTKSGLLRDTGLKYATPSPAFRIWFKEQRNVP